MKQQVDRHGTNDAITSDAREWPRRSGSVSRNSTGCWEFELTRHRTTCLYVQNIPAHRDDHEVYARSIRLIKAHLLAGRSKNVNFLYAVRNAIVDECTKTGLSTKTISKAYKLSDGTCSLRTFLCHLFVCIADFQSLSNRQVPQAFIIDLAKLHTTTPDSTATLQERMIATGLLGPQKKDHEQVTATGWHWLARGAALLRHPVTKYAGKHALPYVPQVLRYSTSMTSVTSPKNVLLIGDKEECED